MTTTFLRQFMNSCAQNDVDIQQFMEQLTFYDTGNHLPASLIQLLCHGVVQFNNTTCLEFAGFPCFCALSVHAGRIEVTLEDYSFTLEENMILLIDCDQAHSIKSLSSDCKVQFVYYRNGASKEFFDYYSREAYVPAKILNFTAPTLHFENYLSTDDTSSIKIFHNNLIITEMLTNIITNTEHSMNRDKFIPRHVQRLRDILDNYYSANHSLDSLASTLHVSKYKLNRDFSKTYSIPPIAYLNRRRISVAKSMLRSTDLSVNEIGRSVGFENTNHFINLFKRDTGITPLVYRKSFTDTYNN